VRTPSSTYAEDYSESALKEGKPLPVPADTRRSSNGPAIGPSANGPQVERHELLEHLCRFGVFCVRSDHMIFANLATGANELVARHCALRVGFASNSGYRGCDDRMAHGVG
jgi:hypothetical protein